uniref:Conotoxin Cl6.12 n=1 Tax=Californiconus californicus TaxID=1736779 RepID=U6CC_CONCL
MKFYLLLTAALLLTAVIIEAAPTDHQDEARDLMREERDDKSNCPISHPNYCSFTPVCCKHECLSNNKCSSSEFIPGQ